MLRPPRNPQPPRARRAVGGRIARGAALLAALLGACAPADNDTAEVQAPLVDADLDGWALPQDCDDTRAEVNPGASELCNALDDDCDGRADDHPADGLVAYLDRDGDGWGDPTTRDTWCGDPELDTRPWVTLDGDCDDGDPRAHIGAVESCTLDGDDDCDGTDNDPDAGACTRWYADRDGDGVGTEEALCMCRAEGSFTAPSDGGDCDDTDASRADGCPFSGASTLADRATHVLVGPERAEAGGDVAPAGDPDGDGLGDLLVASARDDEAPTFWRVRSLVGATGDLGAATATYTATGFSAVKDARVAGGQDLDGDTIPDVVLAAYGPLGGAGRRRGGVVWVDNGATSGEVELAAADATLTPGDTAGPAEHAVAVAVSPDIDGDGLADLFVGGTDGRRAFLFTGPLRGALTDADAACTIEYDGAWASVGESVALPGDLTGDGLADMVVGVPAGAARGFVWIIAGGAGDRVTVDEVTTTIAGVAGRRVGGAVAGPGDVDGDGRADLLVSSGSDGETPDGAGVVSLFTDTNARLVDLADATARLAGDAPNQDLAALGGAGDIAGDIDGDGFADVLLGAPGDARFGTAAGAAFLFFGPVAGGARAIDADLRLYGGGTGTGDRAGTAAAVVGDLDGDGHAELAVGAPGSDVGGSFSGAVYVVAGGPR